MVGSSVHNMIDDHLSNRPVLPAEQYFYPLVSSAMEVEPDLEVWLSGGSKDDPIVGDKALQMVKDCYDRALEALSEIDVWDVEYDASGTLAGCPVPIKAFVDVIGEHKKHGPVIVDWKTSSKKPTSNLQLEVYNALLRAGRYRDNEHKFKGLYAMLRPGVPKARPVSLLGGSEKAVGMKFKETLDRMTTGPHEAVQGFMCDYCFQKLNCLAYSGPTPRALYYNVEDIDVFPF